MPRLDHPKAVRLALDGTRGRAAETLNLTSFESSCMNGEYAVDLSAPSEGTGGIGDSMFGLMDTC